MIALSVIIPLYNTREYIVRCLDSIYSEDRDESLFEVIVINDGSTDGGEVLVEAYAAKHTNLRLIHQENRGLSAARNCGIDRTQGLYLYFLDSDDTLPGFSEVLDHSLTDKEEVVVFGGVVVDHTGKVRKRLDRHLPHHDSVLTVEEYMRYATPQTIVWLSLYRVSFLRTFSIRFIDHVLSEDIYFSLSVYAHNPLIRIVHKSVYFYLQRQGSITQICSVNQKSRIQQDTIRQIILIKNQLSIDQIALIQRKIDYCAVDLLINVIRYNLPRNVYEELVLSLRTLSLYPLHRGDQYPFKYHFFRSIANSPQIYWVVKSLYHFFVLK